MTRSRRTPDELARLVKREERRDQFWFATQLVGLWFAAAAILGYKELSNGIQALPVYVAEMVFFTACVLIAWRKAK